ncbi:PorV/PorQ family protein [candidate division WOR-3 bacterium]|nr:PorV/PorQ family protein [candidate division WOR-3 bacterium]
MVFLFCLLLTFGDRYVGEFMELGVGARALGMGNAFVALCDDPTAFYWNPAGLKQLKTRELFLMHSGDFDGIVNTNTIAFAYPSSLNTLGASIYWIGVPDIAITDSSEAGIEAKEYINVTDYVTYLSYARSFKTFDVGINVKFVFRDWNVVSAYGLGTDIGILSKFEWLTLGLNIVNLTGTELFWSNGSRDWIPPLIKTGITAFHDFPVGHLNFCLGFDTSLEERVAEFTNLHTDTYLGFEYWWKEKLALRVGRDKGFFSTGCGLIYRTLKLDYAMKFHPDLGLVKRFSGSIVF